MAWTGRYDGAEPQRVNKWLGQSCVCSRREAEGFIERGLVSIDGETVTGPVTGVGYITQDANLLPWKTVQQNIELPLTVQGRPKRERAELVERWLELVGLTERRRTSRQRTPGA